MADSRTIHIEPLSAAAFAPFGQVIERAHDGLDPTGLLRELRHGTAHVTERIRDFLQTLTTPRGGAAPPAGGPPA